MQLLRSRVSAALILAAAFLAVAGPAAHASTPIYSFSTVPSTAKAGAHPDVAFSFEIGNRQQAPSSCGCNHDARNVLVHLPTGLIGSTSATPKCTIAQFAARQCPTDSQVGIEEVVVTLGVGEGEGLIATGQFLAPVFNLVPPPGQPALFAFEAGYVNAPIFIDIAARTDSDYGVDATVYNIDHIVPLHLSRTVIWGVPAAPVHNYLRFHFGQEAPSGLLHSSNGIASELCSLTGAEFTGNPLDAYQVCHGFPIGPVADVGGVTELGSTEFPEGVPSSSPEFPFLQNPTTCGDTSLSTSLNILSFDGGESEASSTWPATTECSQLSFNPSQAIAPTTEAADSPSGAEFRLTVPQFESPSVPSPSELKAVNVNLPEGFTLAPNVTNGKQTCSDAQARFGTTEEAECPENSKIGTISVETPVLPGPLPGAVYLGEPKPGNRFRMILAFNGFGVHVKLPGSLTPDPASGRIQIHFENLPQAPFAYFNAHFFGSERGPLDTPTQCGRYEVSTEFTPWDSALSNQTSRQFFDVDSGPNGSPCPEGSRPFKPGFQAASSANTAGAHTAFSLDLTRQDGEQNLRALNITTPPGFSATLKGVSYCPQSGIEAAESPLTTGLAEQANPSCPTSSQVGEFTTGAGPGSHPLYLPGKVYLAGPYQGAPLSLVFITPAVSAGYDLGNVVVREGLEVNPETAQVSTAGAPLPQIFEGIPLRLRQILVNLNRPGFALNPTNCDPFNIQAQVAGTENGIANLQSHFQVANCASLAFAPRLYARFTGPTTRTGNPALHTTVAYSGNEANIKRVTVTLPPTEQIDNAHINSPCTRVQFAANACPASSVIGTAKAETPLLDKPLEGPVYLMTGFGHKLPDLFVALKGQIDINLDGHVQTIHKRLTTTFATVPDAPVSRFTLDLDGGHKGLLENNTNLCVSSRHLTVKLDGQNGKRVEEDPVLQTPCGKEARHKRHHKGRANPNRRAVR